MRRVLVWAIVLVAGAAARADASCGVIWWSSPIDSLPTHGSLYTFADDGIVPDFGARLATLRTTRLSRTVARIDYDVAGDTTFEIEGHPLTFSTTARPPPVPHVVALERLRSRWTCSWTDVLRIAFDGPAAAIHAIWTSSGGIQTDHWLVPHRGFDDPTHFEVQLGHPSCSQSNFPAEELDAGGMLALFAVDPDGTEHLIYDDAYRTPPSPRAGRVRAVALLAAALALALYFFALAMKSENMPHSRSASA